MKSQEVKVLNQQELKEQWSQPTQDVQPFIQALKAAIGTNLEAVDQNELIQAIYYCQRHKLNPLDGDIYFIKYGNKLNKIISYKAMLAKAQQTGRLIGIKTTINKEERTATAIISIWNDKAKTIGEYEATVHLNEYYQKSNPIWDTKPMTMLKKVAVAHAIRLTALNPAINEAYLKEELEQEIYNQKQDKYESVKRLLKGE